LTTLIFWPLQYFDHFDILTILISNIDPRSNKILLSHRFGQVRPVFDVTFNIWTYVCRCIFLDLSSPEIVAQLLCTRGTRTRDLHH
jgi:hypothetical protein